MAKKEIVNVITIKTEESQNTIKGLKKEIADLKKNLDNAVIGSDEFEKASKDLAKAQNNLKTVLADGKKQTDNIEGSYNHLVSTMAELKKEWKATADEVKRNDLAKQIDAINTELKDMDASIGNFQRNVGDYTNSFKDALEQQHKSTEKVRIGLDGLQKTASGLASGYAAIQGTLNLLNIESTEFEKAMIKVQSAMAIATGVGGMKDLIEGGGTLVTVFKNAVTGVKTFIRSLSGVKAAIAATGIGLLVVAVGTLVAYWDDFMALVNKTSPEVEKLMKNFEDFKTNIKAEDEEFEFFVKLKEAAGASKDEILKTTIAFRKLRLEQVKAAYEDAVKIAETEKEDTGVGKAAGRGLLGFWGLWKSYKETKEVETSQSVVDSLKQELDKQTAAVKEAEQALEVYNTEQERKGKENAASAAQSKLDQAKDIAERARQATIDTKMEELAELRRIYEEEKLLLEQHSIDTANLTEEYNQKVKEINDKYKTEGGVLDGLSNPFGESPDPYDTARQQMEQWITDRNAGIATEKEMEMDKIEWMRQNYGDLFAFIQERGGKSAGLVAAGFMESLYTASAIIGAIQDGIDTSTKEGFERNKKLQIANAVIQTLVGVTTALSGAFTTKSGPWDIALAAIQASTIAATGAIQVANIKKQTYDSGNEGDLGSAAAVTPNINLAESMPIQFTRELLSDTETTNLNQAQKVYVLESDITNTQNKVEVAESNSSF